MTTDAPVRRIGPWHLADLKSIAPNGITVFTTFHCGGGSTMGYKLAGCEVIGGVEIDPEMMAVYRQNFAPRHSFQMGVQDFVNIADGQLPSELFDVDILDGSPPCSTFSMAGDRHKKWGGEYHFREGQAVQRLDDLFFDFIDVAAKLRPKVVIAENVKGLLLGKAKGFVKQIFAQFRAAGYEPKAWLLNAAAMGVPQRRERAVFIAVRSDIARTVSLHFDEPEISCSRATADLVMTNAEWKRWGPTKIDFEFWPGTRPGTSYAHESERLKGKHSYFNHIKFDGSRAANTLTTTLDLFRHWSQMRRITAREAARLQTFPEDYDYLGIEPGYLIGMSVPPFMMQRIALEVCRQVFGIGYDPRVINGFGNARTETHSDGIEAGGGQPRQAAA